MSDNSNARRAGGRAARAARRAFSGPAIWAWIAALLIVAGALEWTQTAFAFFGHDELMWYHQDFPALYAAGRLVATGSGHALYDTAALARAEVAAAGHPVGGSGVLAYFNPPFFAALLAPLSSLSLDRAYQAWSLFNLCLLALDAWLLWRIAGSLPRVRRAVLVLGFVTLYPVAYGLQIGQFSLILVASWSAAYLLLRADRPSWAGVALAPMLIKPEMLLPVVAYLAWKRRWAVFRTLLPLAAVAVAASVWLIGVRGAIDYPAYLLDSTRWRGDGVATNVMFDANGIIAMRWPRPSDTLSGLAMLCVLTAALVSLAAYALRGRMDVRSERFPMQWVILTVCTVLIDPHLYLQDTVLMAPAAAMLLGAGPLGARKPVVAALCLGWALLALGVYPNEHLHIDAFALYLVAVAATLALLLNGRQVDSVEEKARPGELALVGVVA